MDGGKMYWIEKSGVGDFSTVFDHEVRSVVHELRTVFPSSTAPAHASFLTGFPPAEHGVVGNQFWDHNLVSDIRYRMANPLLHIHPYENRSLRTSSLLDDISSMGLSWAAVNFPHTFNVLKPLTSPSTYCLYAPKRILVLPMSGRGQSTEFFGEKVEFSFIRSDGTEECEIEVDGKIWQCGEEVRKFWIELFSGHLSVSARCFHNDQDDSISIELGTSVLVLSTSDFCENSAADEGPCSTAADYPLGEGINFFESPRVEWVTETALKALDRWHPDIIFIRYNQADHAQEYLYWLLARGNSAEQAQARYLIEKTYGRIAHNISLLASKIGPFSKYLLFSDHGIDWISTRVNPNAILRALSLEQCAIFQGDSNCAYLYSDEPLTGSDLERLRKYIEKHVPGVSLCGAKTELSLGLPVKSVRVGQVALIAASHIEFDYDAGDIFSRVHAASHGDRPRRSAMSGFLRSRGFGSIDTLDTVEDIHITDLRHIISGVMTSQLCAP
ncbi:alkaline phosphatase family protein [Rathayibacter toxicus]|uniref:alkaline phosphatase family protein n=1 Tax=Rathayibacter toxicus TaxID=145458 RepID=UPI001C053423